MTLLTFFCFLQSTYPQLKIMFLIIYFLPLPVTHSAKDTGTCFVHLCDPNPASGTWWAVGSQLMNKFMNQQLWDPVAFRYW